MFEVIGQGTFGKVVKCFDRESVRFVAVKIVRALQKYTDSAMVEIEALNHLQELDPIQSKRCIQLLDWFMYKNHVCMVFPLLGPSLYEYMKKSSFRPFPFTLVMSLAEQLLVAIRFIHLYDLVHTDLKPENILFNNLSGNEIRVIDFGSATWNYEHHATVITTRHYRAPEVILELGWTFPSDMWSLGCILFELYTGETLFQTHDDHQHLAMMCHRLNGELPPSMITSASENCRKYFDYAGYCIWPKLEDTDRVNSAYVQAVYKLKRIPDYFPKEHSKLLTLILGLLEFKPEKRLTAANALNLFFQRNF